VFRGYEISVRSGVTDEAIGVWTSIGGDYSEIPLDHQGNLRQAHIHMLVAERAKFPGGLRKRHGASQEFYRPTRTLKARFWFTIGVITPVVANVKRHFPGCPAKTATAKVSTGSCATSHSNGEIFCSLKAARRGQNPGSVTDSLLQPVIAQSR